MAVPCGTPLRSVTRRYFVREWVEGPDYHLSRFMVPDNIHTRKWFLFQEEIIQQACAAINAKYCEYVYWGVACACQMY